MDVKGRPTCSLRQSRHQLISSSAKTSLSGGCELALSIAYHHLKKKFAVQSAELNQLKLGKMNSEMSDSYSLCLILERKVEQLQRTLQSKTTAYNNLEATYKQTRENEEALIKHLQETEQMLDDVMGKSFATQKENDELKEKLQELSDRKENLEEELQKAKNIPEVSVSRNIAIPSMISSFDENSPRSSSENDDNYANQKHLKQIKGLLYENKTLKTNMYWLATELKAVKNTKGVDFRRRVRHDSGGLEEGRAGHSSFSETDKDEVCECVRNIIDYTRSLERTITTLKAGMTKNNVIINNLLLKRFGRVPKVLKRNDSLGCCKLTESYVTIDGDDAFDADEKSDEDVVINRDHVISWEGEDDDEMSYQLPELESASVIVPLEELSSDKEIDIQDEPVKGSNMSNELRTQLSTELHKEFTAEVDNGKSDHLYPDIRHGSLNYLQMSKSDTNDEGSESDQDPLKESFGDGALKKFNCPCNLPLSLLHNLELQQTKTYLTSKKSNEGKNSPSTCIPPSVTGSSQKGRIFTVGSPS